ncbi:MAG: TetR/AcrR family transcriptional regulator [candidate division WOR-3 bacterium]
MNKENSLEAAKRQKILEAAEVVFTQKGFFKATIDEIAQKAQIAKGTIYLYFPDKPSIFIGLLAKKLAEVKTRLLEISRENLTSEAKLRKIFDCLARGMFNSQQNTLFSTSSEKVITISQAVMKEFEQKVKPELKRIIKIITEIINQGIKNQEFRQLDPKLLALLFMSTIRSLSLLKFYPHNYQYSSKSLKELFFEILKPRGGQ